MKWRSGVVGALASTAVAITLLAALVGPANGTTPSPTASPDTAGTKTIAAVGDIACHKVPKAQDKDAVDRRTQRGFCRYDEVAKALGQGNFDQFLPVGDIQYLLAKAKAFRTYYDAFFGPYKHITSPVPGNHESYTPYFAGYESYFHARAHAPLTYYSYNLGGWHFVALNSMLCRDHTWSTNHGATPLKRNSHFNLGCRPGDAMYEWLKRDLAAHDNMCTLAYFHHPAYFWVNFAGGPDTLTHPGYTFTRPMYRLFYADKVDVVLSGHMHFYERLKPMNPAGEPDPQNGFTQFIVGMGGDTKEPVPSGPLNPMVAAAQDTTFGLLSMTLHPDSGDFKFVTAPGQPDYQDSGTIQCH